MKWSGFGRAAMALLSALALGLGMTACGGGTIAYMWVIGQQYQQIVGFKVDNYTGNLTAIQNSPFSTNGSNPVYILVRPGGRYVYVINQGASSTSTSNSDGNIASFAVGGDGSLTYQGSTQSAGFVHLWAQFDSSGTFLYVLDRYSPSGSGNGSISVFSSDPNTGRLFIQPQTNFTPAAGTTPTYVEVGQNPLTMASSGTCLFTVNQADQSITPFGTVSGQISTVTTGKYYPQTTRITSINGNAAYMILTDAGPVSTSSTATPSPGYINGFSIASGCTLTPFNGTPQLNNANVSDPVYSFISGSGKYLYILNGTTTSTNTTSPFSSITGYVLNVSQNNALSSISPPTFVSGPDPVCMVEDPTGKFVYTSNHDGGTISGFTYNDTQGDLSPLQRGSTFSTPDQQLGCLALSGVVN